MKIAFVVHDYRQLEGHSRYVVELARRFSQDHEVHVFANQIQPAGDERIHFHHVPAWRPNALACVISFCIMATWKVRGQFDIIHNQGLCGLRGNVLTAHICNRAWSRALRRAAGGLTFHEWVSGIAFSFLEFLFYRYTRKRHVITVSKRLTHDLRAEYHTRLPVTTIYHGVDLNAFTPVQKSPLRLAMRERCGVARQELAFLFVGDLRKGAHQCIVALSRLPAGKLIFVSRSSCVPYMAFAERIGVADRICFAGATLEVSKYYAAADALLLPTHYDSFAMVVTEAMASALPVIVSREAGAAELVEHGKNGLVLDDFGDTEELAQKMALLIADSELAARLGTAARHTAEQYSWDAVAERTMAVYRRVLAVNGCRQTAEPRSADQII